MNNLIVSKDLCKTYKIGEIEIQALKNINFEIAPASLVAFIGPSGSGKSTLLNMVGCLDKQTSGTLTVIDKNIFEFTTEQRTEFRGNNIGFIFQDFNLIPVLTVFENIEYPLIMVKEMNKKERIEVVENLLEEVGLSDQKNKMPNQISGGQKQRVAVARALAVNPKLVLADEPTANLDHDTAYRILDLIRKIKDEKGTTFIFSTHDPKIVNEVDVKYTLEDGRLIN